MASVSTGSIPEEGDGTGEHRWGTGRMSVTALAMSKATPTPPHETAGALPISTMDPARPSLLAVSQPMSSTASGSDNDRTLSAGGTASRPTSSDTHDHPVQDGTRDTADLGPDIGDDYQLVALSLATTVPMTRYNSLPVLTLRELEAMKEKDGELGIERGGDWAWVSSAPVPSHGAAQTAGPARRSLYPWEEAGDESSPTREDQGDEMPKQGQNAREQADGETQYGWTGGSEVGSSLHSDATSTSSTSSASYSSAYPQSYTTSGLSLSNPILIGFSDPFARSRDDTLRADDTNMGSMATDEASKVTTTPKPPWRFRHHSEQQAEVRRYTHDQPGSRQPVSTDAGYRYSVLPDSRRMSETPVPVHYKTAGIDAEAEQARRPSAPVITAYHSNAQRNAAGHGQSRAHAQTGSASDGPASSSRIPGEDKHDSNQQESPKGTRTRMGSIDRPRILRYKTSPARFTGLGLNIVVNAGHTNGAPIDAAAAGDSSGNEGLSAVERRARRHARLRARAPQDSPGGASTSASLGSMSVSSHEASALRDSRSDPSSPERSSAGAEADADATPHSSYPATFASFATPPARMGSWSRVGLVDRMQVDLPAYSSHARISDADLDDLYPPSRGSLSASARGSLSSASDTWSALIAASQGINTPASAMPSGSSSARTSISNGALDADVDGISVTATSRSPRSADSSVNMSLRNVVLLHTTRGMSLPEMTARKNQDEAASAAGQDGQTQGWKGRERFDSLDTALPRLFARTSLAAWAEISPLQQIRNRDTQQNPALSGLGNGDSVDKGKGKTKARSSIFDTFSNSHWDIAGRFETFPRRGSAATVSTSSSSLTCASGKRESDAGPIRGEAKREWYDRRGSWAEGWKGPT